MAAFWGWLRFLSVWLALISAGLSLGSSLTSLNAIQESAMQFLAPGPRNSSEYRQLEWLWSFATALEPLSAVIGALVFKPMADVCGRPTTLLLSCIPFGVGFLIQSLIFYYRSIIPLIVGRIIAGLAYPAFYNTVTVYVVEIAPIEQRGKWNFAYFLFFVIGLALELVLGLPQILNQPPTWHYLLMLICLLVIPCAIILPFLPETPSFLRKAKGLEDKALLSTKFYGLQNSEPESQEGTQLAAKQGTMNLLEFLADPYFNLHKLLIISYSGCLAFGGFAFINYMINFLTLAGVDVMVAPAVAAGTTGLAAISALISSLIIDRQGRRRTLIPVLICITCTLTALLIMRLIQSGNTSLLFQVFFSLFLAISFSALFGVLNSMSFIIGEILPLRARAGGFVVYIFGINGFTAITAQLFNVLEERLPGTGLLLHLVPFVIFSIFMVLALPETKKLTPEQASDEVWKSGHKLMTKMANLLSTTDPIAC